MLKYDEKLLLYVCTLAYSQDTEYTSVSYIVTLCCREFSHSFMIPGQNNCTMIQISRIRACTQQTHFVPTRDLKCVKTGSPVIYSPPQCHHNNRYRIVAQTITWHIQRKQRPSRSQSLLPPLTQIACATIYCNQRL